MLKDLPETFGSMNIQRLLIYKDCRLAIILAVFCSTWACRFSSSKYCVSLKSPRLRGWVESAGWVGGEMGGGMGGWMDLRVGFININDMYNNDFGKGGAWVYEGHEVK